MESADKRGQTQRELIQALLLESPHQPGEFSLKYDEGLPMHHHGGFEQDLSLPRAVSRTVTHVQTLVYSQTSDKLEPGRTWTKCSDYPDTIGYVNLYVLFCSNKNLVSSLVIGDEVEVTPLEDVLFHHVTS